jgi:hypothetical protein
MSDPAVRTAAIRLRRIAGIPADKFTALGDVYGDALEIFQKAKSTDRTVTITAQCQAAFKAMTDTMADFKRRFFLCPPLTAADLVSLGLHPRKQPSPTGDPTAQVIIKALPAGRTKSLRLFVSEFAACRKLHTNSWARQVGVLLCKTPKLSGVGRIAGNPDDRENKGYRIWYNIVAPGETPPAKPKDLHDSYYTKRKTDLIEFEYEDSGKTAWFAVQVENDGKKGPWGPLVSALIP